MQIFPPIEYIQSQIQYLIEGSKPIYKWESGTLNKEPFFKADNIPNLYMHSCVNTTKTLKVNYRLSFYIDFKSSITPVLQILCYIFFRIQNNHSQITVKLLLYNWSNLPYMPCSIYQQAVHNQHQWAPRGTYIA